MIQQKDKKNKELQIFNVMDKRLIKEINDNLRIMGLKKRLISESKIITKLKNAINDLFNTRINTPNVVKSGRITPTGSQLNLQVNGTNFNFTKNEINEINDFLNGTISSLNNTNKSKLISILNKLNLIDGKKLYDDYIDEQILQLGGDEEIFMKNLNKRLNETDRTTGYKRNLKDVLKEIFPDDADFSDAIYDHLSQKLDDYNEGKLINRGGKLVREMVEDILDFKNLAGFTEDEIKRITNTKAFKDWLIILDNSKKNVDEIKRLFKTLDEWTGSIQDKKKIEDEIINRMSTLFNWKKDAYTYMEKFILELEASKDPTLKRIKDKIEKLKTDNKGWEALPYISNNSWGKRRWAAFKAAFKEATGLEKMIGKVFTRSSIYNYFARKIRLLFSDVANEAATKAGKETGNYFNLFFKGSRRGWPKNKVYFDENGNITPDFYDNLRKAYGNKVAWESFGYEWLMRGIKWKTYYAFLGSILPSLSLNWALDDQKEKCLFELSDFMKKREIYTSDEIYDLLNDKTQRTLLPPCLLELVKKQDTWEVFKLIVLADYITSPTSEEGKYFWGQVAESFKNINITKMTSFIPGLWDDILLILPGKILDYIKNRDLRGIKVKEDEKKQEEQNPEPERIKLNSTKIDFYAWCIFKRIIPSNWDEINKIGKTEDGKYWKLTEDQYDFVETTSPIPTETPEIDSVEELKSKYPFLDDPQYKIELNDDKTFKLTVGTNYYTIAMLNNELYYTAVNGKALPRPYTKVESN